VVRSSRQKSVFQEVLFCCFMFRSRASAITFVNCRNKNGTDHRTTISTIERILLIVLLAVEDVGNELKKSHDTGI
jgi:hypothetical protein